MATIRISLVVVALLLIGSVQPAGAADKRANFSGQAQTGAAGSDYATDTFADPWDYSNSDDILLDNTGPAVNLSNSSMSGGIARGRFTDNGYVSPMWAGYGTQMSLARDGSRPGNALNSSKYRTVAFQAYSDHDVSAGLFWFNCASGVGSACGGGLPFWLQQGWHTYVINPGSSVFDGWPVAWGAQLTGMRLAVSPGSAGSDFALDWFRVVEPNSGATVGWSNSGGGAGDLVWDGDSDGNNNTSGNSNWGVLGQVSGASGSADLSALPAGSYRIGVRVSGTVGSWTDVTVAAPLPVVLTPNAVGDRDYATTVLGNPWDMNGADDATVGNATDVTFAGGQLAATNTSNDPYAALRIGSGGIDTTVYRNLTVTSDYDGSFDLRDIAGGGTMARAVWSTADGGGGQTAPILTYAGPRTLSFDMGLPDDQIVEPTTSNHSFVSNSRVTALRWDPNEDRGARRWYLKDVQLRSDFATTGTFPISWQDNAYAAGGTATLKADTDRNGCDGFTVATAVPVAAGVNQTSWNTAGVPSGRYWLCLTITRGQAVTSAYASGVLAVGTNPPSGPEADPNPVGSFDTGALSGRTYQLGGWAFDPNTPTAAINVDVYDQRPDGTSAGVRMTTGGARPDVAAAYPGVGGNTGYFGSIDLPGPGQHTVCAIAINVGPGAHRLLGCRTVQVPGPMGSVDAVSSNAMGTLRVAGWAADPGAPGQPESVHYYVSGPAGTAFGVGLTGSVRSDVASAFPWAGANSGYLATIPAAGAGENQVCGYAINVNPPFTNPLIGCRTVLVRNAFGSLDALSQNGNTVVAAGWALDPNRPTAAVTVHVYDTGPTGELHFYQFSADTARPDVAAAYPGYGSQHGFSATIPAIGAGRHSICVYAITEGGGTSNSLIRCTVLNEG